MSTYNRVTLMGNLTRDPELKKTRKGTAVTDLRLALNRNWTDDSGEKQEETTYVDVVVWGKSAENSVRFLKKGRSVLVEGRLHMDSWKDAKSGEPRSKLRVVADSVQFLSGTQDNAAERNHSDRNGRDNRDRNRERSYDRDDRRQNRDRDDYDRHHCDDDHDRRSDSGGRRGRRNAA